MEPELGDSSYDEDSPVFRYPSDSIGYPLSSRKTNSLLSFFKEGSSDHVKKKSSKSGDSHLLSRTLKPILLKDPHVSDQPILVAKPTITLQSIDPEPNIDQFTNRDPLTKGDDFHPSSPSQQSISARLAGFEKTDTAQVLTTVQFRDRKSSSAPAYREEPVTQVSQRDLITTERPTQETVQTSTKNGSGDHFPLVKLGSIPNAQGESGDSLPPSRRVSGDYIPKGRGSGDFVSSVEVGSDDSTTFLHSKGQPVPSSPSASTSAVIPAVPSIDSKLSNDKRNNTKHTDTLEKEHPAPFIYSHLPMERAKRKFEKSSAHLKGRI